MQLDGTVQPILMQSGRGRLGLMSVELEPEVITLACVNTIGTQFVVRLNQSTIF
jgi:hypothetical protein